MAVTGVTDRLSCAGEHKGVACAVTPPAPAAGEKKQKKQSLEKVKVLNQNLIEIRQLAQDALEDAVLMGCDEAQIRAVFNDLVAKLENPYGKKS